MGFERPTIEEVFARIQASYKANLPQTDPFLARATLFGILASQAAAVHELNGRLAGVVRNAFVDTADLDELLRAGEIYGEARDAGQGAAGVVRVTGVDGTSIADNLVMLDANGQRFFTAFGPVTIAGGIADLLLGAFEIGKRFNIASGASMDFETPIAGVDVGSGIVRPFGGGGFINGRDATPIEVYRASILGRLRLPPQGGTVNDFEQLGFLSQAAVDPDLANWTRVFVKIPAAGSNLIEMWAVDDSLDPDGNLIFPAGSQYALAQTFIKDPVRRPMLADVSFTEPAGSGIDPAITLVPNTTVVQDQVKEEIVQLLIREATIAGSITLSHLDEVISRAKGETDHTLTSPVSDPSAGAGVILTMGTPVFS
ncbi:MAG: baseplate J/gp47 family protein [Vicinamibacteria bacterium]